MTTFFPKFELWKKNYSHLNIANLPLLYTFHFGAINPRHQLLSVVEEKISGNIQNFVWEIYKNHDKEFIITLILLIQCSCKKIQQFGNDNFVLFHAFFHHLEFVAKLTIFQTVTYGKISLNQSYLDWWVYKMSNNKIFQFLHLGTLFLVWKFQKSPKGCGIMEFSLFQHPLSKPLWIQSIPSWVIYMSSFWTPSKNFFLIWISAKDLDSNI